MKHMIAALFLFFLSALIQKPEPAECPKGMVPVGKETCIDVYEWPNAYGVEPTIGLSALPEWRDERAGQVMDLTALCKKEGKRVCTRTEWVAACQGEGRAPYPWGSSVPRYIPGQGAQLPCNMDKRWISPDDDKVAARDEQEMRRLDQREPSGARSTCRSASGAYDMAGSVEEWVTCDEGLYGWCLVGRHWNSPKPCDYAVFHHHPMWHYYQTGGRCCSDRE